MYYDKLNPKIKEYFSILSSEFPMFLHDYINTKEMQRIGKISIDCGCCYTKLFKKHLFYSNLDHSVGVALIIWHFTKNKKATLAGLFHDIATPTFKHSIDFMNGDSEHQESTEEKTLEIIKNSKEIMMLLKRDNIKLEEISDYKKYSIADNEMPKLSSDRLEYNLSLCYLDYGYITKEILEKCYKDIIVLDDELAFQNIDILEEFMFYMSKNWPNWINDADRTSMQFLADICLSLKNLGYIDVDDLYKLSERQVINRIKKCKELKDVFIKFQNTTKCYRTDKILRDKYSIYVKSKRRYLNPLINHQRAYDVSEKCKKIIDDYFNIPIDGYTYFDFNFQKII